MLSAPPVKNAQAKHPELVFGALLGSLDDRLKDLKKSYNILLARRPEEARELGQLYDQAYRDVCRGRYGSRRVKHGALPDGFWGQTFYRPLKTLGRTDDIELFWVRFDGGEGLLKRAHGVHASDILRREREILGNLHDPHANAAQLQAYIPKPLDSLAINDDFVSVLELPQGLYTLGEVRRRYPKGLKILDFAWILKRLLIAVGFEHANGFIHGSLLPETVYIHPQEHGLVLDNWSCARAFGMAPTQKPKTDWDPPEPLATQVGPEVDIYQIGRLAQYLLGADVPEWKLPTAIPEALMDFITSLLANNPLSRPNDAWELIEEFDFLMGPRSFRPLEMEERKEIPDRRAAKTNNNRKGIHHG